MTADRYVGSAAIVLGVALYAIAGDSEAYLFPRLIALAIGVLGLAILVTAILSDRQPPNATPARHGSVKTLLPALAVLAAYRYAMEFVGFYAAAFIAFLVIVWLYAPEPITARAAVRRVTIAAAFVGVIFAVFALLLRVQTPRGILL